MAFTTETAVLFNHAWSVCDKVCTFSPHWSDPMTGYLGHAVNGEHAIMIDIGEVVACKDDTGRKMLFVGTPLGAIVVFHRVAGNENVHVINMAPALVKARIPGLSNNLSYDTMNFVLGSKRFQEANIGEWLQNLYKMMQVAAEK